MANTSTPSECLILSVENPSTEINWSAAINSGILASWDRSMKEISDKLWFAVDYQGGNNYLSSLNFGFSWAFTDKVSVIFGYDIYNDSRTYYNSVNTNKNTFTTQLDINF